jgi:CRP-like cAMP-binding protein
MQSLLAGRETFWNLECFKNLDRDFVVALCDHLEPRLVYPKAVLMRENNYGNEMYILHAGGVRVEKGGRLITTLVSGSGGVVLGDMAVLGSDKRRTATVVCESLCLLYVLHGDVFHEILEYYPNSKRILDHAYISRLVTFEMAKVKDEVAQYDRFYGRAHPMPEAQISEQVYAGGRVLLSRRKQPGNDLQRKVLPPVSPSGGGAEGLPELDAKRGLMLKYAGGDQSQPRRSYMAASGEMGASSYGNGGFGTGF